LQVTEFSEIVTLPVETSHSTAVICGNRLSV
jgi:hypothetical protein